MKNIIFIFSLPRSGSTLLQRILMTHDKIASTAEPWILLPLVYSTRQLGIMSEFSHRDSYEAQLDIIENLPLKKSDLLIEMASYVSSIYSKLCSKEEIYFLDKTPRYYNIIPEIAEIFPEAKFIFLFRNPVQIYSSILGTWTNNRFKTIYRFDRDLKEGPRLLTQGYERLRNKSFGLRYEDLLDNPELKLNELCSFLNIDFNPQMLSQFKNQDTKGKMGDPTGGIKYEKIEKLTLNKWKSTFNSGFRKSVLRNYILNIADEVFSVQGYDKCNTLMEIDSIKTNRRIALRDRIDYKYSKLMIKYNLNICFAGKNKKWIRGKFLS